MQLIERFYDPSQGHVLVDGQDLKEYDLESFRRHVGYVGQEPVLFNTSIRENMRICKLDATDAQIIEALKKSNSWNFLQKNKLTLDSNVGAQGS